MKDLAAWIRGEFAIYLDETTVGRSPRAMGYRKLSAGLRHHAQDPEAAVAFKKNFHAEVAPVQSAIPGGIAIEIW